MRRVRPRWYRKEKKLGDLWKYCYERLRTMTSVICLGREHPGVQWLKTSGVRGIRVQPEWRHKHEIFHGDGEGRIEYLELF